MGKMMQGHGDTLKVGYVLKRFPRLSETFVLNEILELERQGVEVEVFSLLRPPEEPTHELLKCLRAPVTYLPGRSAADALIAGQLGPQGGMRKIGVAELLNRDDFPFDDAMPGKNHIETTVLAVRSATVALLARCRGIQHLHAHFGSDATTAAMLASRLSQIPYSFTAHARDIYHTYIDPETDDRMRRAKIAEAEFLVTVSDFNRRHLIKLAGPLAATKIHRLYNGVDLHRFRPSEAPRAHAMLLAVGRLVEKKGFADLIEACRLLRLSGLTFRCMIVGDGPLRQELETQINQSGLQELVKLAGPRPQEQLIDLMQQATALVLPCMVSPSGDRDGLPTVLLEALASGLPSISTTVAGVPEILEHNKTGCLVPPNDPAELARAINLLLTSPELQARFAEDGRGKAERDFDLCTNVATLRGYFEAAAARSSDLKNGLHYENRLRFG